MSNKLAQNSFAYSTNITFINELYQKFLQDKNSIDASWADFFNQNHDEVSSILADYQGPTWAKRKLKIINNDQEVDVSSLAKKEAPKAPAKAANIANDNSDAALELKLQNLITDYRRYAHLAANLDPLNLVQPQFVAELNLQSHGISDADLNKEVKVNGVKTKVSDTINKLNNTYTATVGCEFEYITNKEQKQWLANAVESALNSDLSKEEKVKILSEVIRTEKFEQFLHKRFPGAKRFSVEGTDSSICAVEKIINTAAKNSVKKVVIGMAHRGRLNTLTGVMGKPYSQMIAEFQGTPGIPESLTKSGDVKYHMGYASTREIAGNKIDLSLAFNPSHLEVVNSVVMGRIRAKQDFYGDAERSQALALLIHGDAAFAGQGSVAESLMMSAIKGYNTGGVIHIIVNNQIGFTANPEDSRSTTYASDLAKAIEAPIFHVNGDDVEAVVKIAGIITQFRQIFKKDVVLDVIGYRKYGHNEGDEPLYTQPIMYGKIKDHSTLTDLYSQNLIASGAISEEQKNKMIADFEAHLSAEFDKASSYKPKDGDWLKGEWKNIKNGDETLPNTAVDSKKLKDLINKTTTIPANFNANAKIVKQLEARKEVVEKGETIDWGTAEALAFASLLEEGFPVRITGQDAGRGTFSHRHSVLHDAQNGSEYLPLNNVSQKAKFEVHDSLLSEFAVLGFEYGYSLSAPYTLTIWEAQFGDFANGAQVIYDQFISSSEVKWLRKSGLVTLLPHGYEGQGPEHSSARLERYLQLCADNNMRVVNITNPANFFHALRRQIHSKDRKPLIVMSPKSLLRHKLAVSTIDEFSKQKSFRPLISEAEKLVADDKVKKLVLCSGKVYYDLLEARSLQKINDVALVRLEQLYPFPKEELKNEIKKYKNAQIIWAQEEPRNMGSWQFVNELIEETAIAVKHSAPRPKYVGRVACASPATGYGSYHKKEQEALINEALK